MIVEYDILIATGGNYRPMREINGQNQGGAEVNGSFSLGCCGTRKRQGGAQAAEGGCC